MIRLFHFKYINLLILRKRTKMIHFCKELFFTGVFHIRDSIRAKLLPEGLSSFIIFIHGSLLPICERKVTRILITIPMTEILKLQHDFKVRTVTRNGGCYVRQQSG